MVKIQILEHQFNEELHESFKKEYFGKNIDLDEDKINGDKKQFEVNSVVRVKLNWGGNEFEVLAKIISMEAVPSTSNQSTMKRFVSTEFNVNNKKKRLEYFKEMSEEELYRAKRRQIFDEWKQSLLNLRKIVASGRPIANIQSESVLNETPVLLSEIHTDVTDMTEMTTATDNHARKPTKDVTTQTEPQTEINTISYN